MQNSFRQETLQAGKAYFFLLFRSRNAITACTSPHCPPAGKLWDRPGLLERRSFWAFLQALRILLKPLTHTSRSGVLVVWEPLEGMFPWRVWFSSNHTAEFLSQKQKWCGGLTCFPTSCLVEENVALYDRRVILLGAIYTMMFLQFRRIKRSRWDFSFPFHTFFLIFKKTF